MHLSRIQKIIKTLIVALIFLTINPSSPNAQDNLQLEKSSAYTQPQLDQLMAPIALYPDQLVAQILMAATYPLEVVNANRWLHNPEIAQLDAQSLASALMVQSWDPSVKSLANFPQILAMMNSQLSWTEQIGDAFLSNQSLVMDSIQRLRYQAQAAGNLSSNNQETVSNQDGALVIEPSDPQIIYVPTYNSLYAYGAWPYPNYAPYSFPQLGDAVLYANAIGFGVGIMIVQSYWGWNSWDWHNHQIHIDHSRYEAINQGHASDKGGEWMHDPGHRHKVPYSSPALKAHFEGPADPRRQNFRGYETPSQINNQIHKPQSMYAGPQVTNLPQQMRSRVTNRAQSQTQQIQPVHVAPVFDSFTRGNDVRAQSQRGAMSRATTAPPRPSPSNIRANTKGGGGRSADERHK